MDIAAGIVGLVSLSGQILQGCNYLCKTFFNAADAPDVILAVSMELCAVRSRLEAFQRLLLIIQAAAPACFRVQQDPAIPLQSCQNAIQKLQSFVNKYADLTISKAPNSKTTVRKAWQKFDVARRCDQLKGYISQLEAAKSSLLAAEASIQLALQSLHLNETREVQRSLTQLQDQHVALAQSIKETRNLITDVHNLQKDNNQLAKMTNLSSEKVVSTNQRLLIQPASSEQYTFDAKPDDGSFSIRISSEKGLPRYKSASSLLRDKSPIVPTNSADQPGVLIYSLPISSRGPKRQKTSKSVFNVWFGRIELTSSATEQEDDINSGCPFPMRLQAQRTSFQLIPNLWFLRYGLLFEMGKIKPTISHPGWDNRLRVFRSHQSDSLIHDAIRRADYMSFRQLLESREVTPFDLVDSGYSTMKPLFETVVENFELQAAAGNHAMQRGLLEIAKLLADLGSDSGAGRSLFWGLSALNHKVNEFSLKSAWGIVRTERRGFSLSVLTKQDEWDLSEFTKLVEDYWGNGSFHFMIANGASYHEWRRHQRQKWRRMPEHVRGSKSYCVAAFGWSFVEENFDQYGVSFVEEKLPSLLREDGLAEEVVRLTGDGQDMEPPPPHSRWKDEDESSAECGEAEDTQGDYDTDSNADNNEDSDDDLSAGWQTADED
ncbi:hypothetical protein GJ744_012226 [Endocarpon pusillum]|uniref:Fungal N-terminal domain-containing protein n=1 Tax=Endocarpon pusillum TaxID=364733 RepID=A0A8H7AJ47_9EURO|nr:hypothetical protein GJ744_012226 [Endocarpon pusillum]